MRVLIQIVALQDAHTNASDISPPKKFLQLPLRSYIKRT